MPLELHIARARSNAMIFWIAQIIFWTLWAIQKINSHQGKLSTEEYTRFTCLRAVIFLATTAGFHYFLTLPFMRGRWRVWKIIAGAIAVVLVVVISGYLSYGAMDYVVGGPWDSRSKVVGVWRGLTVLSLWFSLYFTMVIIDRLHKSEMRSAEARLAAWASELRQLKDQLNPHFLFNSLNTIVGHSENPRVVRETTGHLSNYLRFILSESRPLEPLGREIDALEDYLCVQKLRFGENLQFLIRSSPEALRVMVPPMLIQPLLENAFNYGPLTSPMPLSVRVEALVEEGWLKLMVTNSGTWLERDANVPVGNPPEGDVASGLAPSTGTGLSNLRKRLSLLLGDDATLEISRGPERVAVLIRIPSKAVTSPHPERGLPDSTDAKS